MESPRPSEARASAAGGSTRNGKGVGSSSDESMASELGRLNEEVAQYRRKIADLMGKAPAGPSHARSSSQGGGSLERVSDPFVLALLDCHSIVHL